MNNLMTCTPRLNIYRLSRKGRKLPPADERTLLVMPKEITERTWAELFQKEDDDLLIFGIVEEILDETFTIIYEKYLQRQTPLFTTYCAAQAWLKLIDWQFFRHDPGEEPTAYPPAAIQKRTESWIPDDLPPTCPRDSLSRQPLEIVEEFVEEPLKKWPSSSSIDVPIIENIYEEYWFPGNVNIPGLKKPEKLDSGIGEEKVSHPKLSGAFVNDSSPSVVSQTLEDSVQLVEDVQKITNYDTSSTLFSMNKVASVDGSLRGAGDSTTVLQTKKKMVLGERNRALSSIRPDLKISSKNLKLPPLADSYLSYISDCHLRNLRVETTCEVTSEKLEPDPGQVIKGKR